MIRKLMHVIFISLMIIVLQSCSGGKKPEKNSTSETDEKNSVEILIEAEDFFDSNGEFQMEKTEVGNQVMKTQTGGWLAFDVDIPVAGRYTSQVRLSSGSSQTFWIEDYFDNKDNRTYNITGNMECNKSLDNTDFITLSKDGSPLNAGLHKMKLHIDSGSVKIDRIKFVLLRKHRETPIVYTQNMKGNEWVVVWSDEFNDTGLPDTSKWIYDIGNWGWGNFELQYYTEARSENARIEDGNLIIEARKNDMGNPWTSARITTRGKESFLYGKIEIRGKVPVEKGNWAAGWTLGDSYIDELSWPFNKPQNLILNLAMGGGWGGARGMNENVTSQKLIIDYVRVYELQ